MTVVLLWVLSGENAYRTNGNNYAETNTDYLRPCPTTPRPPYYYNCCRYYHHNNNNNNNNYHDYYCCTPTQRPFPGCVLHFSLYIRLSSPMMAVTRWCRTDSGPSSCTSLLMILFILSAHHIIMLWVFF